MTGRNRKHRNQLAYHAWIVVVATAVLATQYSSARGSDVTVLPGPASTPATRSSDLWTDAVAQFRAHRFTEAAHSMNQARAALNADARAPAIVDSGMVAWTALVAQASGDVDAAVRAWAYVELPADAVIWRHLTSAAAHLRQFELNRAAEAIDRAWELNRDHPLVQYESALVHLAMAEESHDWNDAIGQVATRLVGYRPRVAPNSRTMLRMAALHELEDAIASATMVDRAQPLVPPEWTVAPELRPTVGDVMTAMRASDFESCAHNAMGYLYLDRSLTEVAEHHLDAARAIGADVVFGYERVAAQYEDEGRPIDAARAWLKSLRDGKPTTYAGIRAAQDLAQACRTWQPWAPTPGG